MIDDAKPHTERKTCQADLKKVCLFDQQEKTKAKSVKNVKARQNNKHDTLLSRARSQNLVRRLRTKK